MSLRQKHSQGQNQTILKDNSKQTHTLSFGSVLGNMNVSGFVSCHRSTLSKTPNPLTQQYIHKAEREKEKQEEKKIHTTISSNLSYPPCCHTSLKPVKSAKHVEQRVEEKSENREISVNHKRKHRRQTCHHSVPLRYSLHLETEL